MSIHFTTFFITFYNFIQFHANLSYTLQLFFCPSIYKDARKSVKTQKTYKTYKTYKTHKTTTLSLVLVL